MFTVCMNGCHWRFFNSRAPLPAPLPRTPLHGEAWWEMKCRRPIRICENSSRQRLKINLSIVTPSCCSIPPFCHFCQYFLWNLPRVGASSSPGLSLSLIGLACLPLPSAPPSTFVASDWCGHQRTWNWRNRPEEDYKRRGSSLFRVQLDRRRSKELSTHRHYCQTSNRGRQRRRAGVCGRGIGAMGSHSGKPISVSAMTTMDFLQRQRASYRTAIDPRRRLLLGGLQHPESTAASQLQYTLIPNQCNCTR